MKKSVLEGIPGRSEFYTAKFDGIRYWRGLPHSSFHQNGNGANLRISFAASLKPQSLNLQRPTGWDECHIDLF